jgi:hypothetical protein
MLLHQAQKIPGFNVGRGLLHRHHCKHRFTLYAILVTSPHAFSSDPYEKHCTLGFFFVLTANLMKMPCHLGQLQSLEEILGTFVAPRIQALILLLQPLLKMLVMKNMALPQSVTFVVQWKKKEKRLFNFPLTSSYATMVH